MKMEEIFGNIDGTAPELGAGGRSVVIELTVLLAGVETKGADTTGVERKAADTTGVETTGTEAK